jgi:chorismate mutase
MVRVREETGLLLTTEVANAGHTEEALKAGIDILWIGARTTVNPFSVQEIAEVLRGVDIPVMIKNPVTPELPLWIGALERFQNVGIQNLAAIHRGFAGFGKSLYRNPPQWSLAIEFRRQMPQVPLLCDPSHISGNRDLLAAIAQRALDLDYAGLMIETHPRPEEALSDARQQIDPETFNRLISLLRFSRPQPDQEFPTETLTLLRSKIDGIDQRILEVLAERMEVVRQIGEVKKDANLTVLQINRWAEIFQSRGELGSQLGLDAEMIRQLYELIHLESIALQEKIVGDPLL